MQSKPPLLLLLTPPKQAHLAFSSPPPYFIQFLPVTISPLHLYTLQLSSSLLLSPISNSPSSYPPLPLPLPLSTRLYLWASPSPHLSLCLPTPHHRLHSSTLSSTARAQPEFRLRRSAAASGFLRLVGPLLWPSRRTFLRCTPAVSRSRSPRQA